MIPPPESNASTLSAGPSPEVRRCDHSAMVHDTRDPTRLANPYRQIWLRCTGSLQVPRPTRSEIDLVCAVDRSSFTIPLVWHGTSSDTPEISPHLKLDRGDRPKTRSYSDSDGVHETRGYVLHAPRPCYARMTSGCPPPMGDLQDRARVRAKAGLSSSHRRSRISYHRFLRGSRAHASTRVRLGVELSPVSRRCLRSAG
ncbi:hypothetical protein L227DRAFT_201315 [Lentinus tigrinus ALCF2SS1-6]|uniref:Uncharacterized protein n=1 Tax=Lentinus tigrinus ALCF2SS1-6 TaxID=1328759 RepID=A0A5C2S377_9APHY|nr:hypothetical protein L227DRAFT_201315 [Lentinus tigrinus ALCF2SS1-6]